MFVAPLRFPGGFLAGADRDANFAVQSLMYVLESALSDAAIALGWFVSERNKRSGDRAVWDRSSAIRRQAEAAVEADSRSLSSVHDRDARQIAVDDRALQIAAEQGVVPAAYEHRNVFIHARTFLYSLDTIAKSTRVLATYPDHPEEIVSVIAEWEKVFPNLKGVRDSAHHAEDRARGLGQHQRPLSLKPIGNGLVRADGGALILDSLNNDHYGSTMSDGEYGEVPVTVKSLDYARASVQRVIDAYEWQGPGRLTPSI